MRGRYFEDFSAGERFGSVGRTITETDIVHFLDLSRNLEPQFNNREFYEKEGAFKKLAAPGGLTFVVAVGLFTHLGLVSGTGRAFLGMETFTLPQPLFCGDTLTLEVTVAEKRMSKSGKGIVTFDFTGKNQEGVLVMSCRQSYIVAQRAVADGGPSGEPA